MRSGDDRLLYKDMRKFNYKNDFSIEEIDTCEDRHRFIIEEHYTRKYYEDGFALYNEGKFGNRIRPNTKQRMSEIRKANGSEVYKTDSFKNVISDVTSGENNGMYGRVDEMAVNGRCVVAYADKDCTEIVHTFVSVKTALSFLKLKGHVRLNSACRSGEQYKGYYWKKEWKEYYNEG